MGVICNVRSVATVGCFGIVLIIYITHLQTNDNSHGQDGRHKNIMMAIRNFLHKHNNTSPPSSRHDIIKQAYSTRSSDPNNVKPWPSLGCYVKDKYLSLFQIDGLNFLCQPGLEVKETMTFEEAEEVYYRYVESKDI